MNASDFDGVNGVDADLAIAPQRTSVLAILSLICAVICIIPGTGLLAVIFGISALVGINSSRGRVGGTGLAVSGLVLGLIVTLVWGAVAFGAVQFLNLFSGPMMQPARQSMSAIDTGDFQNARAGLSPAAGAALTDEQIQKFRAAYQAELGSFKGIPKGMDLFTSYGQLGQIMQKAQAQGMQNAMPVPASFDKGTAVLLLVMDQAAMNQRSGQGKAPKVEDVFLFENIILMTPSGTVIELMPQGRPVLIQGTPPPGKTEGDPPPPPEEDKEGGEGKAEPEGPGGS